MWQIILQILAIIGIIILVFLGLIVLLTFLILFVPIRYKLQLSVDTLEQKYNGNAKATWLLRCLSVYATYPEPAIVTIRVFGYPIKVIVLKKEEQEKDIEQSKTVDETTVKADETVGKVPVKTAMKTVDEASEKTAKQVTDERPSHTAKETAREKVDTLMEESKETEKEKKPKWYDKILYTIRSLCDKIKEIWNNIKYYKDLLDERQNRIFFERSKKRIAKLFKGIAPKRCKGNLRVGTGSPDTTGYLLAVYGMLVPYLDKDFYLEPDFEEAVCQGQVLVKGRIYLITLLICVLSFVMDKQLFVLLKKLKREEQ